MTTHKKALTLALEALKNFGQENSDVCKAIKEALSQPEQEPVAWANSEGGVVWAYEDVGGTPNWTDYYNIPLYTTPPQRTWVGLTDEDLAVCGDEDDVMLARYWERVCKEKNT